MGIRLLRGRDFLSSEETSGAAVIDENVARKFFPGLDPIGRPVTLPLAGGTFSVVGVVGATKSNPPAAPPLPRIYFAGPQWVRPPVCIVLRTQQDPMTLAGAIRHEVTALDPDLPVYVNSVEEIMFHSSGGASGGGVELRRARLPYRSAPKRVRNTHRAGCAAARRARAGDRAGIDSGCVRPDRRNRRGMDFDAPTCDVALPCQPDRPQDFRRRFDESDDGGSNRDADSRAPCHAYRSC